MNISILVSIFIFGLLFSLLAATIERLMRLYGLTRGNTIGLVIGSFVLVIFKQLVDHNTPFYVYIIFNVVVVPMSVNRYDLINTIRKGRWWWKSENDKES